MPGTHHIEARVFKDVFPRFKTMQGYRVDRKAGWDCHGLPVELAVEKELGFNGKPDIEAYGVEAFNARCRESVTRHVDEFTELTERMGYWVNLDKAYWTMDPAFVESVWWALKQIHSKGLLVEDYRVAPYCPRCGTTLSDHELAQGYEDVTDPSVYVRFPLLSGPLAGKASLLVWTTTPWTLVSNTAVAVHPDVTYVVATKDVPGGESLVVAEPLAEKVLGDGWLLGRTFSGRELELWRYQRPFELVEFPDVVGGTHYVVLAEYVTTEDGSGLVHQAPAFGEEDMAVCRQYGLPMVNPVRPDGTFEDTLDLVGGMFFQTANKALVDDLVARGLMFRVLDYEHSYPHCWRCHTTAAVLRPAVLVHPHDEDQGRPAAGEQEHQLVPGEHQVGPLRRLAEQQRRLGAVAQPLLGHSPADLALRRRPPDLRRLARRALRTDRTRRWPTSTRTVRSSTTWCSPARTASRSRTASPRSSTRGSTAARCRSRSGATRTRRARPRPSPPPTRPTSSARPSTRPVAGSTR